MLAAYIFTALVFFYLSLYYGFKSHGSGFGFGMIVCVFFISVINSCIWPLMILIGICEIVYEYFSGEKIEW